MSIEDLHDATKIRVMYLTVWKKVDFTNSRHVCQGLSKNIGKILGIAGDELVLEYNRILADSRVHKVEVHRREEADRRKKHKKQKQYKKVKANPATAMILLIIAVLIVVTMFLGLREKSHDDTLEISTLDNDSHNILKPEQDSDEHQDDEDDREEEVQGHELNITATERCWVRVIADGHRVFERTMLPGEMRTWNAKQDIQIRLGNAGGIDITYNGVHMGSPGKSGDVLGLSFPIVGPK